MNRTPSPRLYAALNLVITKGMTMKDAMLEVGYSKSYAASCTQLKNTGVYKQALDDVLKDEIKAKAHHELLEASKLVVEKHYDPDLTEEALHQMYERAGSELLHVSRIVSKEEGVVFKCYVRVPDYHARRQALDMAYKLRGDYAPEKHSHTVDDMGKVLEMSEEEWEDYKEEQMTEFEEMSARHQKYGKKSNSRVEKKKTKEAGRVKADS